MSLAVGEEVVDDHADDGKEKDDESPDDLVGYGTVRLEDLDCGTDASACVWWICSSSPKESEAYCAQNDSAR